MNSLIRENFFQLNKWHESSLLKNVLKQSMRRALIACNVPIVIYFQMLAINGLKVEFSIQV